MDFKIYLLLLVVLCLEDGETGGHGGKHHDHVNVHVPEFIHHDHHTKVITIHHHHHKPKKEHHHHHHHQPKPHIPHAHHYHHKKAHTTTKTESKGHGHHGHHGHHSHHHKSHGHGHHGHHHHDTPSYDPPRVPSYEDDYASSYSPPAPSYPSISHQTPQVHGITHTVKQVKVFDSLPGVIPNTGNHGYEVTEQGNDEEEDVFTSVNGLQQSYPATYGYLRGAAQQPAHESFAELTPQSAIQMNNHDPFGGAIPQPTVPLTGGQNFPGSTQYDPFAASDPTQNTGLVIQPSDFPAGFDANSAIGDQPTSFIGTGGDNSVYLSNDENSVHEGPVSFSREAGVQHSTKTGGVETITY